MGKFDKYMALSVDGKDYQMCYFCRFVSTTSRLVFDDGWIHLACNKKRLKLIEREKNPVPRKVFKKFITRNSSESIRVWLKRQASCVKVFNPNFTKEVK